MINEYPNFLLGYQYRAQARRKIGDFAVAFWKLRVTEQDRKKVAEIWEIILYAVKQIR